MVAGLAHVNTCQSWDRKTEETRPKRKGDKERMYLGYIFFLNFESYISNQEILK
jgi:hypothetical protein